MKGKPSSSNMTLSHASQKMPLEVSGHENRSCSRMHSLSVLAMRAVVRCGLGYALEHVELPEHCRVLMKKNHSGAPVPYSFLTSRHRLVQSSVWSCCGQPHHADFEAAGAGPPCLAPWGPVHSGIIANARVKGRRWQHASGVTMQCNHWNSAYWNSIFHRWICNRMVSHEISKINSGL